jgi:acetylornithine/succinyldiaminopimelate/putrescine aminotransferase
MAIDKATAPQIRESLVMANSLKQAGIRFVPIPVLNEEEFQAMIELLQKKLSELEKLNKEIT